MCYSDPALLDGLLSHLADQMAAYIKYQIESGAHAVQVCVAVGRGGDGMPTLGWMY
jgi:uroporphyrinogen-III decarboxylase